MFKAIFYEPFEPLYFTYCMFCFTLKCYKVILLGSYDV